MSYYPVFLDLTHRAVLVVGGSEVARRRVDRLLEAGADVTVVATQLVPGLEALAAGGRVTHRRRGFVPGDLEGVRLVVTEHLDLDTASAVYGEAEARGIFVNVEDDLPHCSCIAPAVVRRGDLTVAISTAGRAPALAVRLRQRLDRQLGPEYAEFLELARQLRSQLTARHPSFEERRRRWYQLVDSDVLALLREERREEAAALARKIMELAPERTTKEKHLEPLPSPPLGGEPSERCQPS